MEVGNNTQRQAVYERVTVFAQVLAEAIVKAMSERDPPPGKP